MDMMPEKIAFIKHLSEQVREIISQMDEFNEFDVELVSIYDLATSMQEELEILTEELESSE